MGVEVKGAGDGVVIADRGCNDGCGYRDHSGWGSGWGAVGGALVGGGCLEDRYYNACSVI